MTVLALLLALTRTTVAQAAEPQPVDDSKKVGLRDPVDGAVDLSEALIHANGFVPVPILITEPAIGGFGGGLAIVFLEKMPPIEVDGESVPVPPNITMAAGLYTANNSWLAGAGRMATIEKYRLRYRAVAAYADMNVDFYPLDARKDQAVRFNVRAVPVSFHLMRYLRDPRFSFGAQYLYARTELTPDGGNLPDFVTPEETDDTVSTLAAAVEYDGRDNIFSPDSGLKIHTDFGWSDDWLGSDHQFGTLDIYAYWYLPVTRWSEDRAWISGLRLDAQQSFESPPFYLKPFINLRGVPALRYQGLTAAVGEIEERIDFTRRWSVVLFGGVGKAFDSWEDAGDATLVYGTGTGFRYLIARHFKLRMGVDVARGPEDWAYYIIFGSAWWK